MLHIVLHCNHSFIIGKNVPNDDDDDGDEDFLQTKPNQTKKKRFYWPDQIILYPESGCMFVRLVRYTHTYTQNYWPDQLFSHLTMTVGGGMNAIFL